MRRSAQLLFVAWLLISGCALRSDTSSACSDPLGLYTDTRYEACCVAHDTAYRIGGLEADRHVADYELYECVGQFSQQDAETMYTAVRIGGKSRFHYRKD